MYCNKTLINGEQTIQEIYNKYYNQDDGFLYVNYANVDSLGWK